MHLRFPKSERTAGVGKGSVCAQGVVEGKTEKKSFIAEIPKPNFKTLAMLNRRDMPNNMKKTLV